jgi:nucleotide-binding universal stress UspA family protein
MTKKVLIPLDGSALSRAIIPQACRVLDPREYQVILLRVAEPVVSITGAPPRPIALGWSAPMYESARDIEYAQHPIYSSQLEQSRRTELERTLLGERRTMEHAGFVASIAIRFGEPADEIVETARSARVDLIAIATHGQGGLRRLLLGSVAEQVLSRVDIPILLLRPFAN